MDERHWSDIGYNFLVGEDGRVYEGRGWDNEGAQAKGFNAQSVGESSLYEWVCTHECVLCGYVCMGVGYYWCTYRKIGCNPISAAKPLLEKNVVF